MNYGRDYGNRNFFERAANTVRGWVGRHGGGDDRFYDDEYRGGMMNRGWNEDRGYREMGDVSGGYGRGFDRGYGASNWRGRNEDWNRGAMDGWNRGMGGGGTGYRTGGYNASHGSWDVDWDNDRSGGYDRGMNRGMGGGYSAGGYGNDERDHYMGRDFMTNHPHFGHGWQAGHHDDATMDMNRGGGDWNRMGGGMMGRGMQGGMNRGMDADRSGGYDRGMRGGMDRGYGGGAGMPGGDTDMGDASGGMIGNYGAYGNYGIERFRSASGGGVPSGQHFRGYGVGSGYRP
ncbi:MAG TPA: hypothetical protein VEQ60_20445 [Longimicrobium sp.]|nr:hypothetical protein [Longimicrobium sp.]